MALPRSALPSRFGPEVLLRLDQALGNVAELVDPEQAPEPIEASWAFDSPTGDRRVIEAVLEELLEQVLQRLRPRQWGVLHLSCTLKTTLAEPLHVEVGLLRPSISTKHLMELLRLQLERVVRVSPRGRSGLKSALQSSEVAGVALCAALVAPLEFRQGQLFAKQQGCLFYEKDAELPALIERLSNRLGEKTILRPQLWPDAQPEFACRYEPWLWTRGGMRGEGRGTRGEARKDFRREKSPLLPPRPSSLACQPLSIAVVALAPGGPPARLTWQNQQHVIVHSWGPERIETGWWRERDVRRDYYLVETTAGARFWIFRTVEDEKWFLHGIFG
jgi:protein ImuB